MARLRHAWSDDPGRPGGTFAYMPPEQARIESSAEQQKVGPRSDVFALGAVLYFLLTGKPPFEGANWRESQARARDCDFDRKALDDRKVPRELRRICLKAMAADPGERFASAEAIAKARELICAGLARLRPCCSCCWSRPRPAAHGGLGRKCLSPRDQAPGPSLFRHRAAPPAALAGDMTLRVWSPGEGGKRGWKIDVDAPDALPVRTGEMIQVEAKLNQPAYVYILWFDGQGEVTPLYPWIDQDFKNLPRTVRSTSELKEPPELHKGWPVEGPSGLETILMLARRTPLSADADLAAVIGKLPRAPLRNPLEVAMHGFNIGQPVNAIDRGLNRGPAKEAKQIDEPLLQLLERLRPYFEVTRAVRFAYRGD